MTRVNSSGYMFGPRNNSPPAACAFGKKYQETSAIIDE